MATALNGQYNWIILVAIVGVGIVVYSLIALGMIFIYISFKDFARHHEELDKLWRKTMAENDDFFMILERFDGKFDTIVNRQGKIGGLLKTIIDESRKHDRKVAFLLDKLGEAYPDDQTKDPGA